MLYSCPRIEVHKVHMRVNCHGTVGRRAALLAASSVAVFSSTAPAPAAELWDRKIVAQLQGELPAVVPLFLCGGAYCAAYEIDNQPFRAVIDTGSPFMLVDGTCGASDSSKWGCYRGDGRASGLADTDEIYGGQDVGVEWRRGDFRFVQARIDEKQRLVAARPNAVFGIVRKEVGKGGGGAVFLGLAKRRLPRIRPTLLEQLSDIASLRFDFVQRRMELSRVPLIPYPDDRALKLLDLRARGAPVAAYAVRVQRLLVNGVQIATRRPIVAVIDTGTTGISVSDELFDSGQLPAQWREARIELGPTEQGSSVVALEASVRKRRPPSPGVPPSPVPLTAEEYNEFPLICTPVRVPWFAPGFARDSECGGNDPASTRFAQEGGWPDRGEVVACRRTLAETRALFTDGLGPRAPHVLFVGLAFLWQRTLTIDVDTERMTVV